MTTQDTTKRKTQTNKNRILQGNQPFFFSHFKNTKIQKKEVIAVLFCLCVEKKIRRTQKRR